MLSKKLDIKLLVQAGKGYRINSTKERMVFPYLQFLAEAKGSCYTDEWFYAICRNYGKLSGINNVINKVRVEAIAKATQKYYPQVVLSKDEKAAAACGLRPVSPDGLPYIGKSKKCKNLTIASGHAMMGWSMATATGKLVSEVISDKKTSLEFRDV